MLGRGGRDMVGRTRDIEPRQHKASATYLNCDDGAEAIEANAESPGKEKVVL